MRAWLWSIFGNDDDPQPPAFHWPGWPQWIRIATWYLRNPLHNLFTYRWGLKGEKFRTVASLYGPEKCGETPGVWAPGNLRWNMGVTFYGGKEYPFIARRGKYVEWYIGWRLPNGALGLSFRRRKS